MANKIPDEKSRVERYYRIWSSLANRRRESIRKSLVRPLYQEILKTAFLVAVLLVDSMIPLQFFVSLVSPFNIVVFLVTLSVFLFIEIRIYNALWGKNGRWALKNYEVHPEKEGTEKEQLQR
jgi:hypothetical protein